LPHREAFVKPLFVKQLDLVILFVTSICNARCRTCFYWLELNRKGDLTFEELTKLSSTMPEFHDLWVSGGEPFLRKDLARIIQLFYRNNKIRDVRIPTNGLPTAQTVQVVKEVLHTCPELHLEIDVSIDGLGETHDKIRGVPGNFEKALATIAELQALRAQWPNFTLYINSVITQENQNEITMTGRFFQEKSDLDGHYFQVIRGDPKDPALQAVAPQKLGRIYREVLPINFRYLSKPSRKKSLLEPLMRAYWKAGYAFSYETQYRNYVEHAKWKMPCTAGQTSVVIDYNGDVRVCELRKPIGNLRRYGMNFKEFWGSLERKMEVRRVELDQCFCTHICFMYDSMRHSKRVMLWELPSTYVKQWLHAIFDRGRPTTVQEPPEPQTALPLAVAPSSDQAS
jgi:MoaA/NifB/PqqE/SkfB family radical SAM enzyme